MASKATINKRKNVAVIYGGMSCESDVSIITATQAIENIDVLRYNIIPIYLKHGSFYYVKTYGNIRQYVEMKIDEYGVKGTFIDGSFCIFHKKKLLKLTEIDCILLCTHGGVGENGALQGYLDISQIPYTSPSVLQSAFFMDKCITKLALKEMKIPFVDYVSVNKYYDYNVYNIISKLGNDLIIKPASLGSSIGIEIAHNAIELDEAINCAFNYDNSVIIERYIPNANELNCAVYKNKSDGIIVSDCEKPLKKNEILSFADKYIAEDNAKFSERSFINDDNTKLIQEYSSKLYEFFDMKGVIRIDYLVDKENNVYLNEVNTIPGSLGFYLFESLNKSYKDILSELIEFAIDRNIKNEMLLMDYPSSILNIKNLKRK